MQEREMRYYPLLGSTHSDAEKWEENVVHASHSKHNNMILNIKMISSAVTIEN